MQSNDATAAPSLTTEGSAAMLQRAGFSFVPTKIDGTKAPSIESWKEFQTRRPTPAEIEGWYGGGKTRGIAALMGEISGNAETVDFDKAELFEPFCGNDTRLAKRNCRAADAADTARAE